MQAMYGPLRLLHLADMKTACMDKLHYFVLRTDDAIKNEKYVFNVWNELEEKESSFVTAMKAFLTKRRISDNDSDGEVTVGLVTFRNEDSDNSETELEYDHLEEDDLPQGWKRKAPKAQTFSEYVLKCWASCEQALGHDYAIVGWMVLPCPEIQHQVKKRMDGEDKISCNNLLAKLFVPQMLSPEETNAVLAKIEDEFWSEWNAFNERSGKIFGSESRKWMSDDIPNKKNLEIVIKAP